MRAVILAKRSERFPGKHMHIVNGRSIIGRVVDRLRESGSFEDVIILTRDPEVTDDNAFTLPDTSEGTALDSIRYIVDKLGEAFIVAGDMPFIDPEFIRRMIERYNGMPLMPLHLDGTLEPLHGIYNRKMLQSMDEYLASGEKSLRRFLERSTFDTVKIGKDEAGFFYNINYERDLDAFTKDEKN